MPNVNQAANKKPFNILGFVTSISCFIMAIAGINLWSVGNPFGWLFALLGGGGLVLRLFHSILVGE